MVGGPQDIPRDIGGNGHWRPAGEDPAEALLKALEDKENKDPDQDWPICWHRCPTTSSSALSTKQAAAIRKLVSNKRASIRMAAVQALCRMPRDLDNVPVLIYALSDPDPDIAYEANDGLRRIAQPVGAESAAARARRTSGCLPAPSDEDRGAGD